MLLRGRIIRGDNSVNYPHTPQKNDMYRNDRFNIYVGSHKSNSEQISPLGGINVMNHPHFYDYPMTILKIYIVADLEGTSIHLAQSKQGQLHNIDSF